MIATACCGSDCASLQTGNIHRFILSQKLLIWVPSAHTSGGVCQVLIPFYLKGTFSSP